MSPVACPRVNGKQNPPVDGRTWDRTTDQRPVLSVQVERRHLFVVFDSSSGSAFRLRCLRGGSLAAKIPDPPGETTAPGGTLDGDPLAEFRDLGFGQARVFGLGVEPEGYLESIESTLRGRCRGFGAPARGEPIRVLHPAPGRGFNNWNVGR